MFAALRLAAGSRRHRGTSREHACGARAAPCIPPAVAIFAASALLAASCGFHQNLILRFIANFVLLSVLGL